VVVNCAGKVSPERALADVKARITRELRRARLVGEQTRLWARHGSTRWINREDGLIGAVGYVNDWQAGPNRQLLEENRIRLRAEVEALREWLRSQGLPEDGRSVVIGESAAERARRLNEPRTK
jgi:hypothetical protein